MEGYRGLYKLHRKASVVGEAKRTEKRDNAVRQQRIKREATFLERRNVQIQPSLTPGPQPQQGTEDLPKVSRREKLLKWKAERDRVLAQEKLSHIKKPPFKVGVAHHALDPTKELAPSVRATTVKCTTSKKAAAATRAVSAETRNANPASAAASALASLSASTAAFSGRVTRSRTAAAAASAASKPPLVAKNSLIGKVKEVKSATTSVKSCVNPATTARAISSKTRNATSSRAKSDVSKVKVDAPIPQSTKVKKSFAPKDHKFKAPTGLTLPTTPLTLKRKNSTKDTFWPQIQGVNFLAGSPSGVSPPKIQRAAQSQRKGRLSRAVRSRTPRKSPVVAKRKKTQSPSISENSSTGFIVTNMPEPTPDVTECMQVSPVQSTTASDKIQVEESTSGATVLGVTADEQIPSAIKATRPKRSVGQRKQSSSEKENMPEESKSSALEEEWNMDIDPIETMVVDSARMSIHEPSPPPNISPNDLSSGMLPAQFSPYITSARGKDKYSLQKRRSSLVPIIVPHVSPEELAKSKQIEHFRNLLQRESSRLLTLCNMWEERRAEAPTNVQDTILGPVGQARLLVKDKFQQFRRLVDQFEVGESEGKITSDDLTGFWEMMLLTVENLGKRFKELEDLRENNWQEKCTEEPDKKVSLISVAAPKPVRPFATKSRIKDIIEAARKQRQEQKLKSSQASTDVTTFDGGFFKVESPKKLPSVAKVQSSPARTTTPLQYSRRSLLQQVLTNSAVRAQQSPAALMLNRSLPSSPSPKMVAVQIRASELGRRMSSGNGSCPSSPSSPALRAEPTKSILKSDVQKKCRDTPRNRVAFQVARKSRSIGNGSPSLQSSEVTPPSTPVPITLRSSTPKSQRRASLIPRPVSTPGRERPSLLPVRESLAQSSPLPGGDLIDWSSPKSDSRSRKSRSKLH